MKPWELDELRRAVKGKWLMRAGEPAPRRFTGTISTDSRKAAPGDLFIAIHGQNHDAHAYVKDVIGKGVAAVLVHREPAAEVLAEARAKGVAVILVDDTVVGLNRLAAAYRSGEAGGRMRAKVIAVGGSNGKTTTKRIIHTLLAEKFGPDGGHASPKSFNNNIGMPLTLLEVENSHDYVVLEIGTNAPGEIAALGDVCRPDIAVITSVGLEHLEKLGDLEGVAREEASIAPYVADGGTLVLPADAPELLQAVKTAKAQRILVSRDPALAADFVLTDVIESMAGTSFGINGRGQFRLPLLGEHNALNALMAIAVARRLGLSDEQIVIGLQKVTPADGRLQPLRIGPWSIIHDAYNANPTSVEAALITFERLGHDPVAPGPLIGGRKVVILADMLELGASSEPLHRAVGAQVAARNVGLFIAIGHAMQFAADVAAAAGTTVIRHPDTATAARSLLEYLEPGDQILLKGSHGMALDTLLATLQSATPASTNV